MMFARTELDARNWQVEALGLQPLTADPQYIKDGYLWFRDDLNLIYVHLDGAKRALALLGLDGKILDSQLPDLSITDTFVVASEAEMLALAAQVGDVAVRTDIMTSFILRALPPASLGNWQELLGANSAPVQSVNGFIGDVVLTTSDIAEGVNLYFTQTRFDSAFGLKTTDDLAEGANLYYSQARFDSAFAAKDTGDLAEGANLYYTNARVDAEFDVRLATKDTGDLAEGVNLYYTDARVDAEFDVRLATKSTSDLVEGTNLYYTQSRFDFAFAAKDTDDLAEGSTNLYFTNARADARIALQKGAANGLATLDAGGKVPSAQLPAFAVTNTFVVASEAAMLATSAEIGDIAVRTDLDRTYILTTNDPTMVANWQELLSSGSAPVQSVNSFIGNVILTTSDIAEGVNLYYTNARFDTRFATKTTTDLTEGSNLYYTNARFDTRFATKTTTDLTEGSNLYYTNARFDSAFAAKSTTNLSEGSNLYYTNARVDAEFDVRLATKTTTDLAEGVNLYYTDARVATKIASTFVDKETPSGAVDGLNADFALANTPITGSEHVYLNGLLQCDGATEDYTIVTFTITFNTAPLAGSKIRVSYRK